jgi:hypothetical protein
MKKCLFAVLALVLAAVACDTEKVLDNPAEEGQSLIAQYRYLHDAMEAAKQAFAADPTPANESVLRQTLGSFASFEQRYADALAAARALEVAPSRDGPLFRVVGPDPSDPFSYIALDETEPGGPVFNFIDISGTGTLVAKGDDRSSINSGIFAPVTLGAPFSFYGQSYTDLVPSTNGFISTSLTDGGGDLGNDCPLPGFATSGRMYVLHDDLEADQLPESGVYYEYFAVCPRPYDGGGDMGCSIFLWKGANHFPGSTYFDYEALLYDNGDMVFQVGAGNPEQGISSTTGIDDPTGTHGLTYACNEATSITDNRAVWFSPAAEITIDVRPTINPKSMGVIPVMIFSSSTADGDPVDFDATLIDPSTITFGPAGAPPAHDDATGSTHQLNGDKDGDTDLVLHFLTPLTGIQAGDTEACLFGSTTEGDRFFGCDDIRVLDPSRIRGKVDVSATAIDYAPETGPLANVVPLTDDATSGLLPIGFEFEFFGNTYTEFNISSNGFIGFDAAMSHGCCSGRLIPSDDGINNIIAVAWTDLNPSAGGQISYETRGKAPRRRLIVSFDQVPWFAGPTAVTTQAILYEKTNKIEVHTDVQLAGRIYTQGVENADGTLAAFLPGRVAASVGLDDDAVEFTAVLKGPVQDKPVNIKGKLNSLTFYVNHADCSSSGQFVFRLNGVDLASAGTTSPCACNSDELEMVFDDAAAKSAWNTGGRNTLTVEAVGPPVIVVGYIRAAIETSKETATLAVFDATGGDASNRDICLGNVGNDVQSVFEVELR